MKKEIKKIITTGNLDDIVRKIRQKLKGRAKVKSLILKRIGKRSVVCIGQIYESGRKKYFTNPPNNIRR